MDSRNRQNFIKAEVCRDRVVVNMAINDRFDAFALLYCVAVDVARLQGISMEELAYRLNLMDKVANEGE